MLQLWRWPQLQTIDVAADGTRPRWLLQGKCRGSAAKRTASPCILLHTKRLHLHCPEHGGLKPRRPRGPCSQDADYAHASEQNVQSVASHSLTTSMQSWLEFCLPAIHWHWKLALKQCSVILVFNSQHSDQQNAQYSSLNIYITISHWTFLHVSIPKRSSSGNQIKVTPHKTNNPCIK